MSEDKTNITPKITSIKKENDPKRVEAGKRLAMISKEAKERKMREKIEIEKDKSWNIDYGFLFGAIGVASAIGTLCYARRDDRRQIKTLETIKEELEPEHEQKHVVIQNDKSNGKSNSKSNDRDSNLDCLKKLNKTYTNIYD